MDAAAAGRRLIDRAVAERLRQQRAVLAATADDPMPVGKADLLYLWDEHGDERLDFAASMAPLGHRFQPVHDAVAEHMRYYGWTGVQGGHVLRWPVALAQRLSAAFTGPGEEPRRVLFCEGERDAVREAVRLARDGRGRCAVLDTGWHDWLADGGGDPLLWGAGDLDGAAWDGVGALLATALDRQHAPVPRLREWVLAARARGVPVVFDESATGFGRTGRMWGQELAGVVADLTVLGGPLGGGLPLGAVVGAPAFFAPATVADPSPHSGHPWACAAGAVLLDTVNAAMLTHADDCGREVAEALGALCAQFPGVLAGHHGVGLLRGLRFRDPRVAERFPRLARDRGLHLAAAREGTVTICPVLVSSPNEMRRGVDLIADALLSCRDGAPGETRREAQ